MVTKTFQGQVTNGQLQHKETLDAFEGQQVSVTLTAPPLAQKAPDQEGTRSPDESPEGMDVEKDVYVKMPFKSEIVEDAVVIEGGRLPPCIIMPEELPDG